MQANAEGGGGIIIFRRKSNTKKTSHRKIKRYRRVSPYTKPVPQIYVASLSRYRKERKVLQKRKKHTQTHTQKTKKKKYKERYKSWTISRGVAIYARTGGVFIVGDPEKNKSQEGVAFTSTAVVARTYFIEKKKSQKIYAGKKKEKKKSHPILCLAEDHSKWDLRYKQKNWDIFPSFY